MTSGGVWLCLAMALHPAAAQEAPPGVDRAVQEANARIAQGTSPEIVEKTLQEDLQKQDLDTQPPPPAWDVYARARWHDAPSPEVVASPAAQRSSHASKPAFVKSMDRPDE